MTLTKEEIEDKIELLKDAQSKLIEVIDQVRESVEDTDWESTAESYIIAHLENWCYGNNPYDDTTLPKLIEHLEKEINVNEGDA